MSDFGDWYLELGIELEVILWYNGSGNHYIKE